MGGMRRPPSYMRASTPVASPRVARIPGVPQEFLLRDLKEKRKFRLLSRKLTLFVTFVSSYVVTLLLDRNIAGRSIVRGIVTNELLGPRGPDNLAFTDIHSADMVWDWLGDGLFPVLYNTTDESGDDLAEEELYTIAPQTVIVGGFHLLQTRYQALNFSDTNNKGSRCYSELAPLQNRTCFTTSDESEEPFGDSDGTNASLAELAQLDMFNFSIGNDSRSGYQTVFERSSTKGNDEWQRLELMQTHGWLDAQTKHVAITVPLYNYNLQLWSIVELAVDFDLAGGVTPSAKVLVVNLEPYNFNVHSNVLRATLEGIFVGHVVYFVMLELWDVCVLSGGNFRDYMARYGIINNLGDWINILVNLAIMLWRYLSQHAAVRLEMLALPSFDTYVEARGLFAWDEALLGLNLLNMLLMTARALKYFQVTNGGRRLMNSVYGAMPEVTSFLPIYCSVIIGYSFAGHMIYGLQYPEWSTFRRALFRVFELNFGLYDPGPIYDDNGLFSAIFLYSSTVVFCILMLNVFMAIVMSTWDRLTEKEADKATERAQYSTPLGYADMLFLFLTKEDFIDTLIDTALDLEGNDAVTKHLFLKTWKAIDLVDVPEHKRARVLSWYWEDDSSGSTANASIRKMLSLTKLRTLSGSYGPVKQQDSLPNIEGEDEEEDVQVVKTARDLDDDPLRARPTATSNSPWTILPWSRGPTATAKVAVDNMPP